MSARSYGSVLRLKIFGTRSSVYGSAQMLSVPVGALLEEHELPVVVAQRREVAVVGDVEEVLARARVRRAGEVVELVVPVEVHLVPGAVELGAGLEPVGDVGVAGRREQGDEPVVVADDAVEDLPGRDVAGPADHRRHAVGALPVRVLLVAERRHAGVGPRVHVRAVVGGVHDDRVLGEAVLVEEVEQVADELVVVEHRVVVLRLPAAGLALAAVLDVGAEVHVGGVEPDEERRVVALASVMKPQRLGDYLVVDRLHPLLGERARVLDPLGAVAVGPRVDHAAGPEASCGSWGSPPRSGSRRARAPPRR